MNPAAWLPDAGMNAAVVLLLWYRIKAVERTVTDLADEHPDVYPPPESPIPDGGGSGEQ